MRRAMDAPSPALVSLDPRSAEPHLRLYAFPPAGGGPHIFLDWAKGLPDWIDPVAVCYPGRGARAAEPLAVRAASRALLPPALPRQ